MNIKNKNFIAISVTLFAAGALFFAAPQAMATSLVGGNCTAKPGQSSCNTSVSGDTNGLPTTGGWVGQLYITPAPGSLGTISSPCAADGGSLCDYPYPPNSTIFSSIATKVDQSYNVTLIVHDANWNRDSSLERSVTVTASAAPAPTDSLSGQNCTLTSGATSCQSTVTFSITTNGWNVYFWSNTNGSFLYSTDVTNGTRQVTVNSTGPTYVKLYYFAGDNASTNKTEFGNGLTLSANPAVALSLAADKSVYSINGSSKPTYTLNGLSSAGGQATVQFLSKQNGVWACSATSLNCSKTVQVNTGSLAGTASVVGDVWTNANAGSWEVWFTYGGAESNHVTFTVLGLSADASTYSIDGSSKPTYTLKGLQPFGGSANVQFYSKQDGIDRCSATSVNCFKRVQVNTGPTLAGVGSVVGDVWTDANAGNWEVWFALGSEVSNHVTFTVSAALAPSLSLSNGVWTNTGAGYADILCSSITGIDCNRAGPGWQISNAQPGAQIEWSIGKNSDPTSGSDPAFGTPFTSGQIGSDGTFRECNAGAICASDWSVGYWVVKVKVPAGSGAESNKIRFRIWPMQLSVRAIIDTYIDNAEALVPINNGKVGITPNYNNFSPLQVNTDGAVLNRYPKQDYTAAANSNMPCTGDNITGIYSLYPYGAGVAVTENNGVVISANSQCAGVMSVDRINYFQQNFQVPTFIFRSKDTRIHVKATLNGSPWTGSLPQSYLISGPNFSIISNQIEKRAAGNFPTGALYPLSAAGGPAGGPDGSRLYSITAKDFRAAFPDDVLATVSTVTCSGYPCSASTNVGLNYGYKKEYTLNFWAPTLRVSPVSTSTKVGDKVQFAAYYDPDGPGPVAESDVTNGAPNAWSSSNTLVAQATLIQGEFKGIGAGTATVQFSYRPYAGDPALTATAALTVLRAGQELAVSPQSISVCDTPDPPNPTSSITISNIGASAFDWSLTKDVSWLSASPLSGTLAAAGGPELYLSSIVPIPPASSTPSGDKSTSVAISFAANNLSPGAYSGQITVSAVRGGAPVAIAGDKNLAANLLDVFAKPFWSNFVNVVKDQTYSATILAGNKQDINQLNTGLLDLNSRYAAAVQADQRSSLYKQLEDIIKTRENTLLGLAKENPQAFIDNLLSSAQKRALPVALQEYVESRVTLDAEVVVENVDDFQNKASKNEYLLVVSGEAPLYFYPTEELLLARSGGRARVSGYKLKNVVVAKISASTFQLTQAAPPVESTGDQKTLVLMIRFLDSAPPLFSASQAQNMVFHSQMENYYKENSYGKVSFSGDVMGWYTLPRNANGTWADLWSPELQNIIVQNSVPLENYGRVVLLEDSASINSGWSSIGKFNPTINGETYHLSQTKIGSIRDYNKDSFWGAMPFPWTNMDYLLAHELGHALGVWHANSWVCQSGDPIYGSCTHLECGNNYDVMACRGAILGGNNSLHMNAYFKNELGWLDPDSIVTIAKSGRYTIHNLEANSGIRAARIPLSNGDYYYLELRKAAGFDAKLNNPVLTSNQNGLFVNWVSLVTNNAYGATYKAVVPRLLDLDPLDLSLRSGYWSPWYAVTLGIHSPAMVDSRNGVTIGPVTNVSDSDITFNVTIGSAPPDASHIWLSPYDKVLSFDSTYGGAKPAGRNVAVGNTGSVTLNWTAASTPGKWCHVSPTSGSVAPGSSGNITVTVDVLQNVGIFSDCGIRISDPNADNSPQDIGVTYTVAGGNCSLVSPSSIATGLTQPALCPSLTVNPDPKTCVLGNGPGAVASCNFTLSWNKGGYNLPSGHSLALFSSYTNYLDQQALSGKVCNVLSDGSKSLTVHGYGEIELWDVDVGCNKSGSAPLALVEIKPTISESAAGAATSSPPVNGAPVAGSPANVSVSISITNALSVSTPSIAFSATQGGSNPAPQQITIGNSACSRIGVNWSASESIPWLRLSLPTSGAIASGGQAALPVNIDITGLAPGIYTGQITISGTIGGSPASGSPITVNVTLSVGSLPPSPPPPPSGPTISISASPTSIALGQSSTLTWSSTNAASCMASGEWTGSKPTSGSTSVTPASAGTKTYTLSCTGSGGSSASNSVSLTVAVSTYALTVTKAGTGTGTVNFNPPNNSFSLPHSETYASGTSVTLTASPSADSTFAGWSGACSGTGSCVVTMDAAKSVTVTFTLLVSSGFTMSLTPAAQNINPGESKTYNGTVASTGGAATPDFYVTLDYYGSNYAPITFGQQIFVNGKVTSINGFSGQVSLSGGCPSGYIQTFTPSFVFVPFNLNSSFIVTCTYVGGPYMGDRQDLSVSAAKLDGSNRRNASLRVIFNSATGYYVAFTPRVNTASAGETKTYTGTVYSVNAFSGDLNLNAGCAGATCNLSSSTVSVPENGSVDFTFSASSSASGTYYMSVAVRDPTYVGPFGLSDSFTSYLYLSVGGFSGTVNLARSGCPGGVTCTLNKSSVTLTAGGPQTFTLTAAAGASPTVGAATLTVTGTSGSTSYSTASTLTVIGGGGGATFCIFSANPAAIVSSGKSTLSWNCLGAASCSVDHGVGPINPVSGSVQVAPTSTTAYTLTCGSYTSSVNVIVQSPNLREVPP